MTEAKMQTVTITMDGAKVQAPKGTSVLNAAIQFGVCIPHLCYLPNHDEIGACRLCIVENVKNGQGKVTTSCTLEVREGMVVRTNTDKIRNLRRNIAELLVSEAPNSRAIQDIAVRCGVKEVRYPFRNEKCVLCGRCVKICDGMWQAKAIGFVGRGRDRRVDFPFGKRPDYCKMCNSCIELCPMTFTPCEGPMEKGKERLCGKCEAQTMINAAFPDTCVMCDLGRGFSCARQIGAF